MTVGMAVEVTGMALDTGAASAFIDRGIAVRASAEGAVGRIVADPTEAPRLVREMIEHHEHYRRTSAEFATTCRARHHAAEVLRHLLEK